MRSFTLIPLLIGLSHALPQDACDIETTEVVMPTRTATYTTNPVITEYATTAKNLGTYTKVTTISTTKTLQTVTATIGSCQAAYQSRAPAASRRNLGHSPRQCTITVTSTTNYGQTHVWVTGSTTSTFTAYTVFTQQTVTSTRTGGKAYAIASEATTTTQTCDDHTVTLDPRCSPSAMISAYDNFGIEWLSDTPTGGATYNTNSTDASSCCQLCAETGSCAASAWDIRTGKCQLEFPVSPDSGEMNCGEGLLGYYDPGPNHPMSPGTGWYIAEVCGHVQFGGAKPDDGS